MQKGARVVNMEGYEKDRTEFTYDELEAISFPYLETLKIREGYMVPQTRLIQFWYGVQKLTNFKSIAEIGFNAGHSSNLLLTLFPNLKVHSYDIGLHDYTEPNAVLTKELYGDRFNFTKIDSLTMTVEDFPKDLDVVFVDGGHSVECAKNDLALCHQLKVPFIVLDDTDTDTVDSAFRKFNDDTEGVYSIVNYCRYFPRQGRAKTENHNAKVSLFQRSENK